MKHKWSILIFCVLLTLGVAQLPLLLYQANAQTDPVVGATFLWEWTEPTVNEDATPLVDLFGYEFAITSTSQDLRTATDPVILVSQLIGLTEYEKVDGKAQFTDSVSSASLSAGVQYRGWIRALDPYGNKSQWSAPAEFSIDNVAPGVPGELQIKVIIQITVNGGG
ncbi:MAG: hypothetical protein ACXAEN_14875 [Candidatus Thorarchaeota archaeon]|jgi:hypothetical protein